MEYVMALYNDREAAEGALHDLETGAVKLDYSIVDRTQRTGGWWQRLFGARGDADSLESTGLALPDGRWYDERLREGCALAVVRADGFSDRIANLLRARGASDVRLYEKDHGQWRPMADGDPDRWGLRHDDASRQATGPNARSSDAPSAEAVPPHDRPRDLPASFIPTRDVPGDAPRREAPSHRDLPGDDLWAREAARAGASALDRTAAEAGARGATREPRPESASNTSDVRDIMGAPGRQESHDSTRDTRPAIPDGRGTADPAASGTSRQRELEAENSKLRRLVVEQALDIAELRAALKAPKP